jgi:acid stress-induced BolA-like protein IbaG/YrbA
MLTPDTLKNYIIGGLPCTHIEVEGDGQHFYAIIVSTEFNGLSMIKQHQRVYAALGDRMKAEVHALSMKTYTPEQWAALPVKG